MRDCEGGLASSAMGCLAQPTVVTVCGYVPNRLYCRDPMNVSGLALEIVNSLNLKNDPFQYVTIDISCKIFSRKMLDCDALR